MQIQSIDMTYQDIHANYMRLKQEWLESHLDATPEQIEEESKRIADLLGL